MSDSQRDVQSEHKALRLNGMAGAWADLMEQDGGSTIQSSRWLIEHLLQAEDVDRHMRSIAHQMKAARFPIHRVLAGFDFEVSPVDKALIKRLSNLGFTEDAQQRGPDWRAGARERQPTGEHEFDQLLCQELGIEHRLTKPRTPKTNGMVERFNGRISDVLKTHHFHSGEDLEQTLLRYVQLYNHHLPQSALQSKTPMQAVRGWYDSHPDLFYRRPYDRPGLDR